jgi:hypothetical protein
MRYVHSKGLLGRRLTPKFSRMRRRRNSAPAPHAGAACRLQRHVRRSDGAREPKRKGATEGGAPTGCGGGAHVLRGGPECGERVSSSLPPSRCFRQHSFTSAGASAAEPPHSTNSHSASPSRLRARNRAPPRGLVRRRLTPKFSRMRRRRNPDDAPQPSAACRLQRHVRHGGSATYLRLRHLRELRRQ